MYAKTKRLTQDAIVRSDAAVDHAASGIDRLDLADVGGIDEDAGKLLVGGNDHAVRGADAQTRAAVGDGIESVLDLEELARAGEGR